MTWRVSTTSFDQINMVRRPDRTQWLYDLAYAQWRRAELADGKRPSPAQALPSHRLAVTPCHHRNPRAITPRD
eukprot:9467553-Pyramimonas_sp.AAC.1